MTCDSAAELLERFREQRLAAWAACDTGAGDDDACTLAMQIGWEIEALERWVREQCSSGGPRVA